MKKIHFKKPDAKAWKQNFRASLKEQNFRRGSYRSGLTILVLAIVVMLNLVLGQAISASSSLDLSDQNLYKIGDTSKEVLENLSDDLTITLVAQNDAVDPRIEKLVKEYVTASDHITMETLDPVAHPAKAESLGVSENTMLVSNDTTGESRTISFSEIITYDEMSYYTTGTVQEESFDGEGQLTAAIQGLTSDSQEIIYLTEGHGESSLSASLTSSFSKANLQTDTCNLMMDGKIPEDCSLLVIYAPTKDFDATEIQMLEDYMTTGGNIMVLLGSGETQLTNLYAFLKDYGMTVETGYIADMERCYHGNYYQIFPELNTGNEITASMSSDSLILLSNSLGMTQTDPKSDTITVTPLLTTSSNGYLVTESDQTQGTYMLGATAVTTKTEEDGSESTISRLCAISAGSLIDSGITDTFSNLSNTDLFMNAVTWNLANPDTHTSIEAKSLQIQYNSITSAGLISLLFIFLIPILFLIFGLTRWMRRRKA